MMMRRDTIPKALQIGSVLVACLLCFAGLLVRAQEQPHIQAPAFGRSVTRNANSFSGQDIGAKVNAAIASIPGGSEGVVLIGSGSNCFSVSTTIEMRSGVWLRGSGRSATCLSAADALGKREIISIKGASGQRLQDVIVSDLTIRNGTPKPAGYTVGKDGIHVEYADRVELRNLLVTEIEGTYGIYLRDSTNIEIHDNQITRFDYCGICDNLGDQYIYIHDNAVSDAVHDGLSYGISAATSSDPKDPTPYGQYIWIVHNYVTNIPHWEGLDAHGGQHLWLLNNVIKNVHFGIMTGIALHIASPSVLSNITIEGNTIDQGTGTPNGYGIIAQGLVNAMASDIWIEDNAVTGFGASASASAPAIGTIEIEFARNAHILNNTINGYNQYAILPNIQVWNSEIKNNVAHDMAGARANSTSAMIGSEGPGIWGLTVAGNTLAPSKPSAVPLFLVRQRFPEGAMIEAGNTARVPSTGFSTLVQSLGFGGAGGGTPLRVNSGVGQVTSNGLWSQDNQTVISTGDMSAGSNAITHLSGGSAGAKWVYDLPVGMNIVVAGAGPGGRDVDAVVTANDGTGILLNVRASRSVSGAAIRYRKAH